MVNLKNNLKKLFVFLFNIILSGVLLFSVRRWLLRLVGSTVASGVTIHRKVMFYSFGRFSIGQNSTINPWCLIDNRAGVFIADNVNISHNVKIYSVGHDVDDPMCSLKSGAVYIGPNSWIFPNSIIMPGVIIGEGAVVYPGSVITKKVGSYEIWGGNPARLIRMREKNIQYRASYPVWFGI